MYVNNLLFRCIKIINIFRLLNLFVTTIYRYYFNLSYGMLRQVKGHTNVFVVKDVNSFVIL